MPPTASKGSVLVIEDDRSLRELYRTVLRGAGYEVGAVEDGTDALWRIDEWTPDVIVLDLGLPRLHGRDLHFEMRARADTRHVPIVVVTGNDVSDLNPDDFAAILLKPVNPNTLVHAVDDAVQAIRNLPPEPAA